MKKRVLAILLCGVFAMSTLTACGGDTASASADKEEVEEDIDEDVEEEDIDEDVEEEADEEAEVEDESSAAEIDASMFSDCYAGITDDENTYAYLGFGDGFGALMFYNQETEESGSFVGPYETQDNAIIITDESLGLTMTFTVEEGDGGYYLDMGDIGAAFVGEITADEFVEVLTALQNGTTPQF